MSINLLTAGEFATLARTTKRTIHWYDKQGLLEPSKIDQVTNYRYYDAAKVLDFQVIFLLKKLRFSLVEIKNFLIKGKSLDKLFLLKKPQLEAEIKNMQKSLSDLEIYYHNLKTTNTLVLPAVKNIKPFSIYYLEKSGAYAKIKNYALELKSYFSKISENSIYLTLFANEKYNPKSARLTIGVIKNDSMSIKKSAVKTVKTMKIPSYRTLSHMHYGSGVMISLLWKELARYRRMKKYIWKPILGFSSLELYWLTSLNGKISENDMIFELHLPVK